ncbi:MAG: hypothetical protein FWD62_11345 [Betaproteobacteria bacterium]|nr:hypothetical protein [Betaproteobacteria bacterium]
MDTAIWFEWLTAGTALLCALLALAWLGFNRQLMNLFSIPYAAGAGVVARRNGALFLGVAVILWSVPTPADPAMRHMIGAGIGTACATLALLGAFEFRNRRAGTWIWSAVATEFALAVAFFAACI